MPSGVLDVLGKRLARYELTLHSYRPDGKDHPDTDGTTFTFLGFCHVWGKSRKGKNVVRQVTAKRRYARAPVTGHIWTYVRDDRPFGHAAPAALYSASRDRRQEYPERHLRSFMGILQADAP
jgi:hypothetical protein